MVDVGAVLSGIDEDRLVRLLCDAVGCYSPSWHEGPAVEVFARALAAGGLQVERDVVGPGRENLWVRWGPAPVELLWVGHVDTVVRQDRGDIGPTLEGDLLYGLGSADMKAGCAAAVEALLALASSGCSPVRGVGLALVVGEEEYGDGAEALLPRLSPTPPVVVIGEPTDLRLCPEHFGYLEVRCLTEGTQVHAALPHHGDNAIHAMLSWLQGAIELVEQPEFSTLRVNPRQIGGGSTMFIVPAECEATVDFHVAPGQDREVALGAMLRAQEQAARLHPGCRFGHEELFWAPGYRVAAEDDRLGPVFGAFAVAGVPLRVDAFPSHSDASLLYHAGCPSVVCGPGRLEVAHTADEHVSVRQTIEAARLYAAMFAAVALGQAGC